MIETIYRVQYPTITVQTTSTRDAEQAAQEGARVTAVTTHCHGGPIDVEGETGD